MKKRMSKRFLSMLLAVVMVVSMLPVTAFAGTASDAKEEISGVVNNVLDGVDFYYNDKVGVSMNFGSALDPNTLLSGYDVKAMGAVKLTKVGSGDDAKLHADGEAELYVPFSLFKNTIDAKVESAISEVVKPFSDYYTGAITAAMTETTNKLTLGNQTATLPSEMNLAQIFNHVLDNGNVKISVPYFGEMEKPIGTFLSAVSVDINDKTTVAKFLGNYVAQKMDVTLYEAEDYNDPAYVAFDTWASYVELYVDNSDKVAELVEELVAVCTYLKAKELIASGSITTADGTTHTIPEALKTILGKQDIYKQVTSEATGYSYYTYKAKDEFAGSFGEELKAYAYTFIDNDNQYTPGLLQRIQKEFYGELKPVYVNPVTGKVTLTGDTLTKRFDKLLGEGGIIDTFIDNFAGFGVDVDVDISSMFPTDKLSSIETILKSAVKTINDPTGTSTEDPIINGGVYGLEGEALTSPQEETGIYIVAGVNSADIDDMAFQAHVIAPDLVRVEIQGDADGDGTKYDYADKGVFMQTTVGQAYNVKSTVNGTYNDSAYVPDPDNLMELRIDGLTTEGVRYADNSDDGDEPLPAPENAGVYTVLSIYLDRATLAMGADIAVLVVEPAVTAPDDFKFTEENGLIEVTYDTFGHYPSVDTNLTHATIKGAVNKEEKEAYILLNGFDVDSNVDAQVENVEQILDALNKEAEKLHLPTANLTSQAMEAVEKLANFAKTKYKEGVDGGKLTGAEVKSFLLNYLENQKTKYSEANLKAMSSKAYKAALDSIAEIKEDAGNYMATNPTIQQYTALIGTMLDAFEEMSNQATPAAVSTYSLRSADSSAVTEIAASTPANSNEKIKLLAEKVVNTLLAKSGVNDNNVSAVVNSVLNYVGGVDDTVINSKYYDDAVALVKTMGAAAGADDTTVDAAVAEVTDAFSVMYDKVLKLAQEAVNAHLTDGDKVYTLESIKAKIDELTKAEAKALAADVLSEVSAFVSTVMDQAKNVVNNTDWTVTTVYFNIEPSEVGVYDCYAVNVNPNYVPNLTKTTLEIVMPVTIVVKDQTIGFGGEIKQTEYTVKTIDKNGDLVEIALPEGMTVELSLVEGNTVNNQTAGTYEDVIEATVAVAEGYKYKVTVVDEHDTDTDNYAHLTVTDCQHQWDEGVVTTEPTCKDEGVKTYTCQLDSTHTKTESIPVDENAHDWNEGVVTTEPTCKDEGVKTYTCQLDSTHTKTESIPVDENAHTEVIDAAVAPTCTTTGLTEGSHCSVCNEVLVAQREIPTIPHAYDEGEVTLEPTCTATGLKNVTCSACGDTKSVSVPALGHTDDDGNNVCDVCGEGLTGCGVRHTVPDSFVVENVEPATCCETTGGQGSYDSVKYCEVCGEELFRSTNIIPQKACVDENEDGKCDECGCDICTEGNGHTWIVRAAVEPTCDDPGLTQGVYCTTCKHVVEEQIELPRLGHIWNAVKTIDPTCTKFGHTEYVCERDTNHTNTGNYVLPLGHVDEKNNADGTDGADGLCDRCNEAMPCEHLNKTWETEPYKTTPPTCTVASYAYYKGTCVDCNAVFSKREKVADALGHKNENGDLYCDVCGALLCTHTGERTVIGEFEPTCTQDGYRLTICSECGLDQRSHSTGKDALGHVTFGTWYVNANRHYELCKVCGADFDRHYHNFTIDNVNGEWVCSVTLEEAQNGKTACGYTKKITAGNFDDAKLIPQAAGVPTEIVAFTEHMQGKAGANAGFTVTGGNSVLKNLEFTYSGENHTVVANGEDVDHFAGVDETIFVEIEADDVLPADVAANLSEYDIYVTHMFASDLNGQTIGGVEHPDVTVENGVLYFSVNGLSPVMFAWKEKATQPDDLFRIYGTNMTVGNDLTMNFFIKKADLEGTDYYAVITKTYADGRANVVKTIPYADFVERSKDLWQISFNGVAAKEMADDVYVTVYNGDGTAASYEYIDSVRSYGMRLFEAYSDDSTDDNVAANLKLTTAVVDMLNYGAACQNHFTYDTEDLANNQLEAEDQQHATPSVTYSNKQVKSEKFYGTVLSNESNIIMNLYFTDITTDMHAVVTYTDYRNRTVSTTVAGSDFTKRGSLVGVVVDTLVMADGYQLITCEVYDADNNLVASAQDSIESVVARFMENPTYASDPSYVCLLKFVTSAKAYLLS